MNITIRTLSLLLLILSVISFKYANHKKQSHSIVLYGNTANNEYMTISEIEEYAKLIGLRIQTYSTGPLLRLEAFPINNTPKIIPGVRSDSNDDKPIGYLTAFIRPIPSNLLHLETIQVQNRRQNLGFRREGWSMDGPGISFILGSYALVWAYQKGCTRTELLAVKDSETMHQILVRLYENFGFKTLRNVGDDGKSLGDRLLWGAVGTLMDLELEPFLKNWTPKLREYIYAYQPKP